MNPDKQALARIVAAKLLGKTCCMNCGDITEFVWTKQKLCSWCHAAMMSERSSDAERMGHAA